MSHVPCVLLILAVSVAAVTAVDLIELNDPNQAILGSVMSKGVRNVQKAIQSGFQFANSDEVDTFLDQCDLLEDEMNRSSDADYKGLAKQIKSILADTQLATACKAKRADLDQFRPLDKEFKAEECDYLAASKLQQLIDTQASLEANESLKLLFGHLFRQTTEQLSSKLLSEAAKDMEILLGEQEQKSGWFDFETRYKRACSLSQLKPICKLVRRDSHEEVTAVGADLIDFGKLVQSGDEATIRSYEQSSGVSMEQLKQSCANLSKAFKPMRQIEAYEAANLLSSEQISSQRKASVELDLYYELYQLCKLL